MQPIGYCRNTRKPDYIKPETVALILLIYGQEEDRNCAWVQVLIENNIWDVHTDFLEQLSD